MRFRARNLEFRGYVVVVDGVVVLRRRRGSFGLCLLLDLDSLPGGLLSVFADDATLTTVASVTPLKPPGIGSGDFAEELTAASTRWPSGPVTFLGVREGGCRLRA